MKSIKLVIQYGASIDTQANSYKGKYSLSNVMSCLLPQVNQSIDTAHPSLQAAVVKEKYNALAAAYRLNFPPYRFPLFDSCYLYLQSSTTEGFTQSIPLMKSTLDTFRKHGKYNEKKLHHPRKTYKAFLIGKAHIYSFYGYNLFSRRGNGIDSRTCSIPESQVTVRSKPKPKPE